MFAFAVSCLSFSSSQLETRIRIMEDNSRILRHELQQLQHQQAKADALLKETEEKVKMNKQLPYLVANVVEVGRPSSSLQLYTHTYPSPLDLLLLLCIPFFFSCSGTCFSFSPSLHFPLPASIPPPSRARTDPGSPEGGRRRRRCGS